MLHRPARRPRVLLAALAVPVVVLAGCFGGDDTTTVSDTSDDRPTTTTTSGSSGDTGEYCATASEVTQAPGGLDLSQDAESALAGVEQLAAVAPEELADDFDTFLSGIRGIAQLDEDDPDALTGILELMPDPDFSAAADAIEQFTSEECDVDLGAGGG